MTSAQLDSYRLMVVDNGSAFKFHFGRSHSLVTHNALWRARGTTIVQCMSPDVQLMSPDVQLLSPDVRRQDELCRLQMDCYYGCDSCKLEP